MAGVGGNVKEQLSPFEFLGALLFVGLLAASLIAVLTDERATWPRRILSAAKWSVGVCAGFWLIGSLCARLRGWQGICFYYLVPLFLAFLIWMGRRKR